MSDQRLTTGARLTSAVCTTEVVVVRVSDPQAVVECGGAPMLPVGTVRPNTDAPQPGRDAGTLIGKRYGGPDAAVELLCVKPGAGTLSANGVVLALRTAKPLPASD
jgi:hypothetical protein